MEDAVLRISQEPGRYNLDNSQSLHKSPPLPNTGIAAERIFDAPPSSAVDTESELTNRYDIIGRYGLMHVTADEQSELFRKAKQQQKPQSPPKPQISSESFFTSIDDRVPRRECDAQISYYRFDPNPPQFVAPIMAEGTRGGSLTKLAAKDTYGSCHTK